MSKPDDVSQWAWDEVRGYFSWLAECWPRTACKLPEQAAHRLARAIQTAKAEAYEEAAKVGKSEVMKFRARVGKRYYPGYHEDMRDAVDAAIRKLGSE